MRLEACGVSKCYKTGLVGLTALEPTSFRVEEGEFLSIVGPSGSGKSTLMSIIGLLDRPTSGKLLVDGKNCADLNADRIAEIRNREIGFVFQSYHLLARLTVLENVELPLMYCGAGRAERRRRAEEALNSVELGRRVMHKPSELSGGEQQRVAIARAIVSNPSVILADEPTGALDSSTGREILRLLQSCHKIGRTVVIVTHDNNIARQANRMLCIQDGRLISDNSVCGQATDLQAIVGSRYEYTRRVSNRSPRFDG